MLIFRRFNSQYLHNIERGFGEVKRQSSRKPYLYTGLGFAAVLGSWATYMKLRTNKTSEIREIYKKERNL